MSAFYRNPQRYPPKFWVRRNEAGLYTRLAYAGEEQGKPAFNAMSVHLTPQDAVDNRNPIPAH